MGGYVGRCVVEPGGDGCFECFVWHDGEFPFSDDDGCNTRGCDGPFVLHHCSAKQFIKFGQLVDRITKPGYAEKIEMTIGFENPETGAIKLNFPHLEAWEMRETCSLDVADRGGITLEEVGAVLNLTRERIRQVEVRGLAKIKNDDTGGELGIPPDRQEVGGRRSPYSGAE